MRFIKPTAVLAALSFALPSLAACQSTPAASPDSGSMVELTRTDGGFTLTRNGEPYIIHGVGGTANLELLKSYGGNTIRTWDAEGIEPLMDEAHELGIAVVVGIWLEHQRHGFDYDNPVSKKEQLDRVETFVKQFRHHPALLAWGVGNELELGGEMDTAIRQINDAAAIIKRLDSNHPTMAVIAEIGDDKAVRIQKECPDIDFIGINSYGGMGSVAQRVREQGYTGAYAITEYGPVGHWESGNAPWGAPYEQSSSEKAVFLRANYLETIEPNLGKNCLGGFAFLWGHKQEKTETWYGLILPTGETTQSVDVVSELWTGKKPDNLAPRVSGVELVKADAGELSPGQRVSVVVSAEDPDGNPLDVQWRIIPESRVRSAGGDFEEKIKPIEIDARATSDVTAEITLPQEAGAYRIFATVRDGKGHGGTANLPILIGGETGGGDSEEE